MRLLLPIFLLVGFLAISFAFERSTPRAELTVSFLAVETLDPQVAQAQEDIRVTYCLFEGLLSFDPITYKTIPGQADRYDVSDDGLVYTFHLRDGLKWSDGRPLTTDDFVYAWRLGLMPDTSPPYIAFLQYLKGGEAFTDWCLKSLKEVNETDLDHRYAAAEKRVADSIRFYDENVGVKALDSRTLQVTLERRTPYFSELAQCWPLFPLPRHVIEPRTRIDAATSMLRRDQQWTKPDTIVSNGPYTLTRWRFKRDISVAANPLYWDDAHTGPRTIDFIAFADPSTMYTAYASGAIDIMFSAHAVEFAAEISEQERLHQRNDVNVIDEFGTYYYVVNCSPTATDGRPNPLADARVRKALCMAVDKKAIVDQVTRQHQKIAASLVPPGAIEGYPDVPGLPYDIPAARKLLAEAGYPDGRGLTIEVCFNSGGGHKDVSQALQRMWHKELGIDIKILSQEWKTILDRRNRKTYDIARSGWTGDYSDPTTFTSLMRGGDGNNDSGLLDARLDKMLADAELEPDPRQRLVMLAAAEKYAMNELAPVIPLYYYRVMHLAHPERIQNFPTHPHNMQRLSDLRVVKK